MIQAIISAPPIVPPDGRETQYKRLYDYLAVGNTITFLIAMELKIDNLNQRITDLRKHGIKIYSRPVRIKNVQCKEYSLWEFKYHALLIAELNVIAFYLPVL